MFWASSACCWRWSAYSSRSGGRQSRPVVRRLQFAQFYGWKWGKKERPASASRSRSPYPDLPARACRRHVRLRPGQANRVFGHLFGSALPLTYLPILLIANDRTYMGTECEREVGPTPCVLYFFVILVIAFAAIPLMLLTNGGQGEQERRSRHRPQHSRSPTRRQRRQELRQGRRFRDHRPRHRLTGGGRDHRSAAKPGAGACSEDSPPGCRETPFVSPWHRGRLRFIGRHPETHGSRAAAEPRRRPLGRPSSESCQT